MAPRKPPTNRTITVRGNHPAARVGGRGGTGGRARPPPPPLSVNLLLGHARRITRLILFGLAMPVAIATMIGCWHASSASP